MGLLEEVQSYNYIQLIIIKYMLKGFLQILSFSTTKNYTSTFKVRSRLSEFFKHVHPDQLAQAPTKVKEQNLRSLTNFNAYIDSISQSKPIQAKLLRFYIAEKNNLKSKKFFSFTVQLPQIANKDADLSEDKAKKLIDNIVDVLNKKFYQSKTFRGKQSKISQQKVQKVDGFKERQTQQQRFHRMASNIKPFDKKTPQNQFQIQMLKKALNTKYMQAEKQTLQTKLKKSISFADTGSNKPTMWSRIASSQSGLYKDYQKILNQLIDPRLIYFSESLTLPQTQQFLRNLLPGTISAATYKSSKIILEICSKMQSFQPPLCFYVSDRYGVDIPGFFTIPYNFKAEQLGKFYEREVDRVVEELKKYEQYWEYERELRVGLRSKGIWVEEENVRNNGEIWQRILMMKRLERYGFQGNEKDKKITVIGFSKEKYEIFINRYDIKEDDTVVFFKGKVIARVDFKQKDMEKVMKMVNKGQKGIQANKKQYKKQQIIP